VAELTAKSDLLRSLGRLVRGLSALFWNLPICFLVCYYTARAEALRPFGIIPPLTCTGLLMYGLWQLSGFQSQERVWRLALDRAGRLGLVLFFLSPFLYWWNRIPESGFFTAMVLLLSFCALLFLGSVNLVLQRLGAMLPDEALRMETKQFTALNLNLIVLILVLGGLYLAAVLVAATALQQIPPWLEQIVSELLRSGFWFVAALLLLALVPLAMTMAMLWKVKEVILDGVFGGK
jgi:hypothetical protein